MRPKDPAAVALGRKGGKARAKKLTSDERTNVARRAAEARWAKTKKLVVEISERAKALERKAKANARRVKAD